ncbi:MAG TPA: hypothetical protein VEN99_08890, partial [Acidimicrobiia bacterium]|nr:hypothetical protein [Acidimicrobiia bacterium]
MTDLGVVAAGVYVPRFGTAGRRGRRFRCGSDEDAVTLAVEAGERALAHWPGGAASVGGLFAALDHGPDVHGTQAQVVREALDLPPATRVAAAAVDGLAGMAALQAALDAVRSGAIETALVVAAEAASEPEARRSAGAVALVVAAEGSASALRISEVTRRSALTHEDWRPAGGGAAPVDPRFLSHRYRALLRQTVEPIDAGEFDGVVFSGGFPGDHREVRRWLGVTGEEAPDGVDGADFGPAGPLMALVHALRAYPAQTVGLVAYGAGQAV